MAPHHNRTSTYPCFAPRTYVQVCACRHHRPSCFQPNHSNCSDGTPTLSVAGSWLSLSYTTLLYAPVSQQWHRTIIAHLSTYPCFAYYRIHVQVSACRYHKQSCFHPSHPNCSDGTPTLSVAGSWLSLSYATLLRAQVSQPKREIG